MGKYSEFKPLDPAPWDEEPESKEIFFVVLWSFCCLLVGFIIGMFAGHV